MVGRLAITPPLPDPAPSAVSPSLFAARIGSRFGPLLATLRAGSLDLIDFVAAVRDIDTLSELQALVDGGPS